MKSNIKTLAIIVIMEKTNHRKTAIMKPSVISNNRKRKIIYRIFCLINKETKGKVLISHNNELINEQSNERVVELTVRKSAYTDQGHYENMVNSIAEKMGEVIAQGEMGDQGATFTIESESDVPVLAWGDVQNDRKPLRIAI